MPRNGTGHMDASLLLCASSSICLFPLGPLEGNVSQPSVASGASIHSEVICSLPSCGRPKRMLDLRGWGRPCLSRLSGCYRDLRGGQCCVGEWGRNRLPCFLNQETWLAASSFCLTGRWKEGDRKIWNRLSASEWAITFSGSFWTEGHRAQEIGVK